MRFMFVTRTVKQREELLKRLTGHAPVYALRAEDDAEDRAKMMRAFHDTPESTLLMTANIAVTGFNVPDDTVLLSVLDISFSHLAQLNARANRPQFRDGSMKPGPIEVMAMSPAFESVNTARVLQTILDANPDKVEQCRGRSNPIDWFIGQFMKATNGKGNPTEASRMLLHYFDQGRFN